MNLNALTAEQIRCVRGKRLVLDAVDITIAPGELVALIGPNGAGKSTLLRLLAAELNPQGGCCRLDGQDVHGMATHLLARRRAVLPQDARMDFPLRVDEVIALGRDPWRRTVSAARNREAIVEATRAVGAQALCSRDYRALSGGERQRVQLARVLAQIWDVHWDGVPRYLLLDEPTASLDIGHQQRLLKTVRSVLSKQMGVMAVLHDLNLAAAFADRIYLMHRGRMTASGAPRTVLVESRLNAIYEAQLSVHAHAVTGRPVVLPGSSMP